MQWSKEVQVDAWVREKLKSMGLELGRDFLEKDASAYLKDALKGVLHYARVALQKRV